MLKQQLDSLSLRLERKQERGGSLKEMRKGSTEPFIFLLPLFNSASSFSYQKSGLLAAWTHTHTHTYLNSILLEHKILLLSSKSEFAPERVSISDNL